MSEALPQMSPETLCKRDLYRESMGPSYPQPEWLGRPDLVPDEALVDEHGVISYKSYYQLAEWMTEQYATQTQHNAQLMDFNGPVEKRGLEGDAAVSAVEDFYNKSYEAFDPGFSAIAEIVAAVPAVAARHSVPRHCWGEVAKASVDLGEALSRDGTHVQSVARAYLATDPFDHRYGFDARCLKIDQSTGGLTTGTPIEDIVSTTFQTLAELDALGEGKAVCIALQVIAQQRHQNRQTVFGQAWNTFSDVTAQRIYPHIDVPSALKELPPDPKLKEHITLIAQISYTRPKSLTPLLKACQNMIAQRGSTIPQ